MELIISNPDLALFTLRLALSIFLLAHGPFKIFYPQETSRQLNTSSSTAMTFGVAETIGALSLMLGLFTNIGAFLVIIVMLSYIYIKTQRLKTTFTGHNGWQLEFIALAAAFTIFLAGAGSITII